MRKRLIISFSIIMVLGGIAVVKIKKNKSPEMEILEAGKLIKEAQINKTPKYANDLYNKAVMCYDSAMTEWRAQNNRFILVRNYNYATELAKNSIDLSNQALIMTKKNIITAETSLDKRISELGDKISYFKKSFGNFPMSDWHQDELSKSSLVFTEGVVAFEKRNYNTCKLKLDSVDFIINVLISYYHGVLTKYFNNYPEWEGMIEKNIQYSHKHKTQVIIIDKLSRELIVYYDGKTVEHFPVEMGLNWIGDKQQQGDKTTPEGSYKIIEKKQNGQTRYYKAFLLDYPNNEDKNRFAFNKKNAKIKPDANIGNLIEIHGNGGKGINWTDGCIALKDTDMDKVFSLCPVGTKVIIVGSTKPLNELSYNIK